MWLHQYFESLRSTAVEEKTEHTDRSALETLLRTLADSIALPASVQHEPKRVSGTGAPDFKISRNGMTVGYIEVKAIGTPLSEVIESAQIKKYLALSKNIVITDYLHWVWLRPDGTTAHARLADQLDLKDRRFTPSVEASDGVLRLLASFLSTAPEGLSKSGDLAAALAVRSRILRDFLAVELSEQAQELRRGKLYGLLNAFRAQVFHELTMDEFSDAFAQMLAYGLFLAKLHAEGRTVTLANAKEFVPESFTLIRELVAFLDDLNNNEYRDIRWVIEEILSLVNSMNERRIRHDLSFSQQKAISKNVRARSAEEFRLFSRDPFIYFYEDFLAKYDSTTRKSRGVYYTPPPVVNFIVRASDHILRSRFDIEAGFADHDRVTVLDFACGTGTFLVEILEQIFNHIGGSDAATADLIIKNHALKNIYGFEFLIAPYTIAHLKLSQYLAEKQHPLRETERFQVFLTNTLEPIAAQINYLLPALSAEAASAQAVKDKPILVITGNPPYSGVSKNPSERIAEQLVTHRVGANGTRVALKKPVRRKVREKTYIGNLIEAYKYVDGEYFGERKHWLNDDYVKFIRFAQHKMGEVDRGVVSIITNHAYIDNPTFRGMRQSLLKSFDEIFVINLHGSVKKKERAPDGSVDKNVFDIAQGVAISIFVKTGRGRGADLYYADIWGDRLTKYEVLARSGLQDLDFRPVTPVGPHYFFTDRYPKDFSRWTENWSLDDIFMFRSAGMITAADRLTIGFSASEVSESAKRFMALPPERARQAFNLGKDSRDWKITYAQEDLKTVGADKAKRIGYRVLDDRFTIYSGQSRGFIGQPAAPLGRHMAIEGNVCLVTTNRVEVGEFKHAFVFESLPDGHSISSKETNQAFPLYVASGTLLSKDADPAPNFTPEFTEWVTGRYGPVPASDVFSFIYAVLNTSEYRSRYSDFLLVDFPRIPFPEKKDDFNALAAYGHELIQTHLLKGKLTGTVKYEGQGDHTVRKVHFDGAEQRVRINSSQSFVGVTSEAWNLTIGSYRPIEKYLQARVGRELTLDEISHLVKMVRAVDHTLKLGPKLDEAYRRAFSTDADGISPTGPPHVL